jgi:hypothetical protein
MEGRFKFLLHMVIMVRDMWRENACINELGKRTLEPLGRGYGHGVEKHAAYALKAKNAREALKAKETVHEVTGESQAMPHVSKRRRLSFTSGRIELPAFMFREFPRGFVTSLSDRDTEGRAKYMTIPVSWFMEGKDELLSLVKKFLPAFGTASTTQKFRAKMALQQWMAVKLKARYDMQFPCPIR